MKHDQEKRQACPATSKPTSTTDPDPTTNPPQFVRKTDEEWRAELESHGYKSHYTPPLYPVDIDALEEVLPNEERVFYIATDDGTCAQYSNEYPITQTLFGAGHKIQPTAPLLPAIEGVVWSEYEARMLVHVWDAVAIHQTNELTRYLKRSGVGMVKVAQVSP